MSRTLLAAITVAVLEVAAPSAEWALPGQLIPASRLIQNLETRLQNDRRNADLLANLARLHAYTFATKRDSVFQDRDGLYAPHPETDLPASYVIDPLNSQQRADAARHLDQAIVRYREALNMNGRHLIARLGLAWCLEQAGRTSEATSEYRTVFDQAWQTERKLETTRHKPFVTEEAGQRLVDLLGANITEQERLRIEARTRDVTRNTVRAITPIVVPLDPTWSPYLRLAHRAMFDADGSGVSRSWSWIPPAAAWLVYDDRNGKIESALQMFGTVTFWMFWDNGYDALCSLDDSGDGRLTGRELKRLALWHDANINGVSDAEEVTSLARHGIVALSCRHVVVSEEDSMVAAYSDDGVTFLDGSTRPTYDVILSTVVR